MTSDPTDERARRADTVRTITESTRVERSTDRPEPLSDRAAVLIAMTLVVSAVSTLRGVGLGSEFLPVWLSAWGLSWIVACPTVLVILPLVRRVTGWLCP